MAENNDFRHIVRVANTDLNGSKPLLMALQKIKGVGHIFSHAICYIAGIDENKQTGTLSNDEVEKLTGVVQDPVANGIPTWMLNRRKDLDTGSDIHLISSDLTYTLSNDIKGMMKLKIYRGTRHSSKLPVRGQNTKSNFRRSKVKNAAKRKNRK